MSMPRIPHMIQVTARICHEKGLPPPEGLVFDEESGVYVVDESHPVYNALGGASESED